MLAVADHGVGQRGDYPPRHFAVQGAQLLVRNHVVHGPDNAKPTQPRHDQHRRERQQPQHGQQRIGMLVERRIPVEVHDVVRTRQLPHEAEIPRRPHLNAHAVIGQRLRQQPCVGIGPIHPPIERRGAPEEHHTRDRVGHPVGLGQSHGFSCRPPAARVGRFGPQARHRLAPQMPRRALEADAGR